VAAPTVARSGVALSFACHWAAGGCADCADNVVLAASAAINVAQHVVAQYLVAQYVSDPLDLSIRVPPWSENLAAHRFAQARTCEKWPTSAMD